MWLLPLHTIVFGSTYVLACAVEQHPILTCSVLLLLQIVKLQQAIQEAKGAKDAA